MKKTYEVELRRTSFITVTVEADTEDAAEELAWKELTRYDPTSEDAAWIVESIEEMK